METKEGSVTHLQNTISVSGGGNNNSATTTYIALFRLDGQAVQFRCGAPISIAEGDRIKVAGNTSAAGFNAYAVRDLTTGVTMSSGVWGNVIMAIILPIFGLFFCGIASFMFGKFAAVIYLAFLAGAGYLIYRALRAISALKLVRQP